MMMYSAAKDNLRAMRLRANQIFKGAAGPCIGVSLLYTLVSLALSVLTLFINSTFLYAVTLLVLAFIAASLQLGLCEYFLLLRRGEKPSAKLLMRYFDQDALPMVAALALISWAAGMIGMLLSGISFFLQIIVSAFVFPAPYLYVTRGGTEKPTELLKEGAKRMQGRWEMYFRIILRQYLYALAASVAAAVLLMIVMTGLSAVGLAAFFATEAGDIISMVIAVLLAVAVSAVVSAYFQVYMAELAAHMLNLQNPAAPEKMDSRLNP